MPASLHYRNCDVRSHLAEETTRELVDSVLDDTVSYDKVFRDNWRTLSARIQFRGQLLLLKVPRARNARSWERVLTWFRGSDANRSFDQLGWMQRLGFNVPEPVMVCERRRRGMVVDSFLVYQYAQGRAATEKDAGAIVQAMLALHQKGYLRNDPQLANFLIDDNGGVIFIDFRLKPLRIFPTLGSYREIAQFVRSCPAASALLPVPVKQSVWFHLADSLEALETGYRTFKKRIRKRRKKR